MIAALLAAAHFLTPELQPRSAPPVPPIYFCLPGLDRLGPQPEDEERDLRLLIRGRAPGTDRPFVDMDGRGAWIAYCSDLPRGPHDDKKRLLVALRWRFGGDEIEAPALALLAYRRPLAALGENGPRLCLRWRRR